MYKLLAFRFVAFVVAAAALMLPAQGRAEPTDLDTSFGVSGIARFPESTWLQEAAAYADGRIALLIADHASPYAQSIVRLNAVGHIDASFVPVGSLQGYRIDSIAVAGSNRLATLQSFLQVPNGETRLTRHLEDGSLDPAFGQLGSALVSRFPYYFHARLGERGEFSRGLTIDASDRLYTSTELRDPSISATWITRIGATGRSVEQLNRSAVPPSALMYGPIRTDVDGRVVALLHGYEQRAFGGATVGGPALIRLADGVPDRRFGLSGIAFHPVRNWLTTYHDHGVYDLASTPDGGYVVIGSTQDGTQETPIVVVKFTAAGEVDTAFGDSGVASVDFARLGWVINANLAVQPDGRIVVASTIQEIITGARGISLIGLARLTATGQADMQFAGGGVTAFWVEGGTSARFVSVRPDARIVVAGEITLAADPSSKQPSLIQFLGGNSTTVRPFRERRAVEYFHAGYGHYFLTADAHEIAKLNASPIGWAQTGLAFSVWDDDDRRFSPVCRFWSGQSYAPKSSHFYTPYADECERLKRDPSWMFERNAFYARMPEGTLGTRTCPTGAQPLYRAYNDGKGGAPNHRYTTDAAVLDAMIAQGWVMEGEAATRVFACVPLQK